jgi:hypothetical protein
MGRRQRKIIARGRAWGTIMLDAINRILSGQALTRPQLVGAGVFVAVWFLMDAIQFADWVWSKFR